MWGIKQFVEGSEMTVLSFTAYISFSQPQFNFKLGMENRWGHEDIRKKYD